MPRLLVLLPIRVGGKLVRSETTLEPAGADSTLVISTSLADHALILRTIYIAAEHPDQTALAIDVLTSRRSPVPLAPREIPGIPVRHARRLCLTDHAARLQQLLTQETGSDAAVEITDTAAEAADRAFDQT